MKKGEDKGGQGDGRKEYQCLSFFLLTLLSSSLFSLFRIKFRLLSHTVSLRKGERGGFFCNEMRKLAFLLGLNIFFFFA